MIILSLTTVIVEEKFANYNRNHNGKKCLYSKLILSCYAFPYDDVRRSGKILSVLKDKLRKPKSK